MCSCIYYVVYLVVLIACCYYRVSHFQYFSLPFTNALQDKERSEMLEHFRTLTVEATQLGSNNMTLESEARSTRNSLKSAESKIANLESEIESKDRLISSYLEQVPRPLHKCTCASFYLNHLSNALSKIPFSSATLLKMTAIKTFNRIH